ncbi:MAG: bifunctional phosphopantothenoylcysteine decarboxylase/phosphopantothenate--cysteine ligase CoaBC [Chthoniobacterales bacterium]|nr:bifunctional phosphopantothenoylcysteine decarboxylase/phosphopantothenate--cysteine ligase CoaBC [Chthoniobacterales bacterium]
MRIVVTAGPTREPIDPVRFISNRSSGKMGYAIAEAALERGDVVTLISGPVAITPPKEAALVQITTSDELYAAVHQHVRDADVLVMCAAVSDYKPTQAATRKLEKQTRDFSLPLTPTRDILASLAREDRSCLVVGFAAETHDLETRARTKLARKNCDMIVANDVSGTDLGMESDYNAVTVFFANGDRKQITRAKKRIVARELMKIISEMIEKRLTKKT